MEVVLHKSILKQGKYVHVCIFFVRFSMASMPTRLAQGGRENILNVKKERNHSKLFLFFVLFCFYDRHYHSTISYLHFIILP